MKSYIVIDVPVLHKGYLNLFLKYKDEVSGVYLLGERMRTEGTFYHEEIRALSPFIVKRCIETLALFSEIEVLENEPPQWLKECRIIASNDALSKRIIEKYFNESTVVFDTAFLRWDEKNVTTIRNVRYDRTSTDQFDRSMIKKAKEAAAHSSDYWRHVGGVAVMPDGNIIVSGYNQHVPSEHLIYSFGDPRDHIKAGVNPEIATALHAEQWIISWAARKILLGTKLYLTMFPCAMCAKEIAYSGINTLYFEAGHVNLNGEEILRSRGVEIIQVIPEK